MSHTAVEVDHIWKKFKRGELYDSLRDLIPALVRRAWRGAPPAEALGAREFWALQDVSFEVKHGEVLGIIGPNGSGKSTMLKLLSGIMRPTAGRVKVNGRLSALIEVGAGFHPDLTGRENIYLNGAILGMTRRQVDRLLDEIIAFSGLEAFIDTPVKRYSSGMYARLGFSVAAHVDPEILLVDEVLSVGDMQFQKKCIEKMLAFASGGRTVIFISHNLTAIHNLCRQTALLRYGKLVKLGPTDEVIAEYLKGADDGTVEPDAEARVTDVKLTDDRGNRVDRLTPGQRVYVTFQVDCAVPYDECMLEFQVHRLSDGLPMCVYNNFPLKRLMPLAGHTGASAGLLAFNANLLRGSYAVSLYVLHSPRDRLIGGAPRSAVFSINEMDSYRGMTHLNPVLVCPGQLGAVQTPNGIEA